MRSRVDPEIGNNFALPPHDFATVQRGDVDTVPRNVMMIYDRDFHVTWNKHDKR